MKGPVRWVYAALSPRPLRDSESTQVIVTSYLFPGGVFSLERLKSLANAIGKDKLVVDVR